jgi:hypothetical protein
MQIDETYLMLGKARYYDQGLKLLMHSITFSQIS